jgi:hypothetical protein
MLLHQAHSKTDLAIFCRKSVEPDKTLQKSQLAANAHQTGERLGVSPIAFARLLLEAVIASVEGNIDRMEVELRWAGGFISRHTLMRSVQTYKQLSYFDELVARIDVLRTAGHSLAEIASKLNEEGFRPPKRSPKFNAATLSRFLRERGIRAGPQLRSLTEEDDLQKKNGGCVISQRICRCQLLASASGRTTATITPVFAWRELPRKKALSDKAKN